MPKALVARSSRKSAASEQGPPIPLLVQGNTKLGDGIWQWSIPAKTTCTAKSEVCQKLCYALRGHYNQNNVQSSLNRREEVARHPKFGDWMIDEIRKRDPLVVRIHVAGDFFSISYIQTWERIIREFPHVHFFTYTRAWNDPALRPHIRRMGQCANLLTWLSCDSSMPKPPDWQGFMTAFLSQDDTDGSKFPPTLMFRATTKTVMKKDPVHGTQVCPYEQGTPQSHNVQCQSCGICWDRSRLAKIVPATVMLTLPTVPREDLRP